MKKSPDETTGAAQGLNAALIFDAQDGGFLTAALENVPASGPRLLVSDEVDLQSIVGAAGRLDFSASGFDVIPIQFERVCENIKAGIAQAKASQALVDMRWGLRTVSASANFEKWSLVCDRIATETGVDLVSIYSRGHLIDDQFLAAFRGHRHFVAPSGVYENPYWLPPDYADGATLGEQIAFLLRRFVPDYCESDLRAGTGRDAATGADPGWIASPRRIRPQAATTEIWKIRCFGRLRIYLSDGSQIKWDIPGSAPKKSKALFACLLQCGEKGARADTLAEFLWPDEPGEQRKRGRLHHAVAMLRKTLGGKGFVLRTGEYYSLLPPPGTWIDISSFEQLCNRAKVLARDGQQNEAISLLDAADRLYSGDLFEDLAPGFVENDLNDWVFPRRVWLREMAIKVQRDKARILRERGQLRAALDCCQKALAMDPTSDYAHAEAMRIFAAQGRPETVARQYRQYRAALEGLGAKPDSNEIEELYRELAKIK